MIVESPKQKVDWRKRKAIVFQSDDWGLCGLSPDLSAFRSLCPQNSEKSKGSKWIDLMKSTLETPSDLDRLFEVLSKYKGRNGRPAVFQSAYVMSSPDYRAIAESGHNDFSDIAIPDVPDLWKRGDFIAKAKEGMRNNIWHPTYHGNSHFNRFGWIKNVRAGNEITMQSFKYQTFADAYNAESYEYDPALAANQQEELISTGIERFYRVFGYYPKTTIPPAYVWQDRTEAILAKHGIEIIQGKNFQVFERPLSAKIRGKITNLAGKRSSDKPWQISMGDYSPKLNLRYLKRNVYFEPFGGKDVDHGAEGAYRGIVSAWEKNEPAVVCTHRINYVHLDEEWVSESLRQLDLLLNMIQTNQPEAVYMTDHELVSLWNN